ncbi:MAG: peptidoglycan editing factor PgeF [Burkholderiales bacterium]|nr:peptidoglycan editing factor PgeF [Burkholderiales bacterium]
MIQADFASNDKETSIPFKPKAEIIVPDWPAPKNVQAFFTLRRGGFSEGPYGDSTGAHGLNLGVHVGDKKETVLANRDLVRDLGCKDIKWLNQIHSTNVVEAKEVGEQPPDADGAWTMDSGMGCVVMTADCLPVLLCSSNGGVVAAAHAGWKGLADGVLQATVKEMQKHAGKNIEIMAWLGPRIGERVFVVQDDVRQHYLDSSLRDGVEENIVSCPEGFLLNLAGFAKLALKQVAVEQVFDCGLSTFENKDLFYSYRRDGITGRHAAVIYKNA